MQRKNGHPNMRVITKLSKVKYMALLSTSTDASEATSFTQIYLIITYENNTHHLRLLHALAAARPSISRLRMLSIWQSPVSIRKGG